MKKLFVIIICFIITGETLKACDICGCGVGNNYIGILPDFNKHIIGLRYRQNSLLTHVGEGGQTTYLTTTEGYRTMELWAGWNIGSRFRLMTSVPYSFNSRENQGTTLKKNGPGDVSLTGFYNLLNQRSAVQEKLLVQSLWIGGGVKLPTGKYNPLDKSNTSENTNLFQLGTGSTDFLLNAMYDVRLNDAGLSASALYKLNTGNRYDYTYGNKLSLNVQAYYKIRILQKFTLAPNAGVSMESGSKDADKGLSVDVSGGNLSMGTLGAELSLRTVSFGGNFQHVLSQNLAHGIVQAQDRFMVHVSFLL